MSVASETLTNSQRGMRTEIHLAVHADGRWCEFPNDGATPERCNQQCAIIADVAVAPLGALEKKVDAYIEALLGELGPLVEQHRGSEQRWSAERAALLGDVGETKDALTASRRESAVQLAAARDEIERLRLALEEIRNITLTQPDMEVT
jgi:hypothetical protein